MTGGASPDSTNWRFIRTMANLLRLFLAWLVALGAATAGAGASADPAIPINVTVSKLSGDGVSVETDRVPVMAYRTISVSGQHVIVRMRASDRQPGQRLLDAGPLFQALPGRVERQGNILAYHDFRGGQVRTVDFLTGLVRERGTVIGKDEALERSDRASVWLSVRAFEWLTGEAIAFMPGDEEAVSVEVPPKHPSPNSPAAFLIPASVTDAPIGAPYGETNLETALEDAIAAMAFRTRSSSGSRNSLEAVFDQRVVREAKGQEAPAQYAASPDALRESRRVEAGYPPVARQNGAAIAVSAPGRVIAEPMLMQASFEPPSGRAPAKLEAPTRTRPASAVPFHTPPWTGDLRGTVMIDTDGDSEAGPEDDYLEGQLVRLTRLSTGETLEHRSAAFGQYGFSGLPPGRYELAVTFGREPVVYEVELGGRNPSRRHDVLVEASVFEDGGAAVASRSPEPRLRS